MPTKAQNKATAKYVKEHYKQINLKLKHEEFEALESYAKDHGGNISGTIKEAIKEYINPNKPQSSKPIGRVIGW